MGMIFRNNISYGSETRVELTQAEYDALTTEQKMNGTAYYITDGEPSILSDYQTKDDDTLATSNKTVVGGINEVNSLINTMSPTISGLSSNKQDKNDSTLETTNKTVVGAINEVRSEVKDVSDNKIPVWLRDSGSSLVQAPGDLSQFGAWIKTQITANRVYYGKVSPTNSGYFGTSSFYFQVSCSSTNYGVALLLCDNNTKASMVTGQLVGGTWYWYAHQGTAIS